MLRFPIKILSDPDHEPFFPFIVSDAVFVNGTDKTVSDYLADRYTKGEVDEMFKALGTVMDFRGVVETEAQLPKTAEPGDVYLVLHYEESTITHGVIWQEGEGWTDMGTPIDLDDYFTKEESRALVADEITKYNAQNREETTAEVSNALKTAKNYTDNAIYDLHMENYYTSEETDRAIENSKYPIYYINAYSGDEESNKKVFKELYDKAKEGTLTGSILIYRASNGATHICSNLSNYINTYSELRITFMDLPRSYTIQGSTTYGVGYAKPNYITVVIHEDGRYSESLNLDYNNDYKFITGNVTDLVTRYNTQPWTPTYDYGVVNKKYVDDAVSALNKETTPTYRFDINNPSAVADLQAVYNSLIEEDYNFNLEIVNGIKGLLGIKYIPMFVQAHNGSLIINVMKQEGQVIGTRYGVSCRTYEFIKIGFNNGGNSAWIDSVELYIPTKLNDEVIGINNTWAWTPTTDYGPVHKKYVDDNIKQAIGTALGGSY